MLKKIYFFAIFLPFAMHGMEKPDIQKKSLLNRFLACFSCNTEQKCKKRALSQLPSEIPPDAPSMLVKTDNPKISPSQSHISESSSDGAYISRSSNQPSNEVRTSTTSTQPSDSQDFLGSLHAPPSLALNSSSPILDALQQENFTDIPLS